MPFALPDYDLACARVISQVTKDIASASSPVLSQIKVVPYGHCDEHRALDRIVGAYASQAGSSRNAGHQTSVAGPAQERLF
jgi:hypothetical protein